MPEPLILESHLSPGDIVALTAAVRDLHRAHPGRFRTDIRTSAAALWENNPWIMPLGDRAPRIEMHYPLIHESNRRPCHFLEGYVQFLEQRIGLRIPITEFRGDVHLSERERREAPHPEIEPATRYWIIVAGGKHDYTAKWWDPAAYQQVVDRLAGVVSFVQCGQSHHWHPRLRGVCDLVGKTTLRQFVRLMYWADGVVCPVTFAMHLAAAVPTPPGRPSRRPAVVIAGGREPPHWEAYPHHRFLSTVGTLPCCQGGGCWRSRCQTVGDGDALDWKNRCARPIHVARRLQIPQCMAAIRAEDVVRAVLAYEPLGVLQSSEHTLPRRLGASPPSRHERTNGDGAPERVLITFSHGLGDTVQLSIVLAHLREARPHWSIDVAAPRGRVSAVAGLCRATRTIEEAGKRAVRYLYDRVFDLKWHECRTSDPVCPSTKPSRALREVFGIPPREALFRYEIVIPAVAARRADRYLRRVCRTACIEAQRYPAVLFHYRGRTSPEKKDLPESLIARLCEIALDAGLAPIVLDRGDRNRLADGRRIFCPARDDSLERGLHGCDAAVLAALIARARLMVGIDSGPLHVAGATNTPTLGVWTRHHPIHYYDLADNVLHLVPRHHERLAAGPEALAFFESHYRFEVYRRLESELPERFAEAILLRAAS